MPSSWTHRGFSSTTATVIGLAALYAVYQAEATEEPATSNTLRWVGKQVSNTTGTLVSPFTGTYPSADSSFQIELARAYEKFSAAQKPLDREFATLLVENLWDLYAR